MSTTSLDQLPTTSFSELLRALDPLESVSKELDPTDGMHIGPGLKESTPLGHELNVWGIRKRYVTLLNQALSAARSRIEAGRAVLLSDYKILLRCAGAAANIGAVRAIWEQVAEMDEHELDPEAFAELARACFLTEPLYAQYDLARLRVRPINLHMTRTWILGRKQRHYLRVLGHNMSARRRHRFGYDNQAKDYSKHLARSLRSWRTPLLLHRLATRMCYIVDERTLCGSMIALARSGSLRVMERRILEKYWGIQITRRAGCEVDVTTQAINYPHDSPLRPTGRLLEAIVHSYCTNANFSTALVVLDAVSSCYAIPVSERVWFDLLEWASVLASKPVITEWRILNRQFRGTKVISRKAVQMVWDTMTAEPYNVRPGFRQYLLLARSLISRDQVARALDVMLELEPMYRDILAELESAFSKHALSTALGVNVAASAMAWRRVRARKHAALYHLQILCVDLLKKVCKSRSRAHMTVRGVPQFIEAFRDLLPENITYRIPTGTVRIHHIGAVTRLQETAVKFTQLPISMTGDSKITVVEKKRERKIEEKRLGPTPHASLHGFLTRDLSWLQIQREFS
jgi:hypothetical protein